MTKSPICQNIFSNKDKCTMKIAKPLLFIIKNFADSKEIAKEKIKDYQGIDDSIEDCETDESDVSNLESSNEDEENSMNLEDSQVLEDLLNKKDPLNLEASLNLEESFIQKDSSNLEDLLIRKDPLNLETSMNPEDLLKRKDPLNLEDSLNQEESLYQAYCLDALKFIDQQTCLICDAEFDSKNEGIKHIQSEHSDVIVATHYQFDNSFQPAQIETEIKNSMNQNNSLNGKDSLNQEDSGTEKDSMDQEDFLNHEDSGDEKDSVNHEESLNQEDSGNEKDSLHQEDSGNEKDSLNQEDSESEKDSSNHEDSGNEKDSLNQEDFGNEKDSLNQENCFLIGDPVWAKMKGFSSWPGTIELPPEHVKRPITKKVLHCVFFFGNYKYGWVPEADLKPYEEFKSKMNTTKKALQKAIDEIEAYIQNGCKFKAATIVAMSKAIDKATPKRVANKDTPQKTGIKATSKQTDSLNLVDYTNFEDVSLLEFKNRMKNTKKAMPSKKVKPKENANKASPTRNSTKATPTRNSTKATPTRNSTKATPKKNADNKATPSKRDALNQEDCLNIEDFEDLSLLEFKNRMNATKKSVKKAVNRATPTKKGLKKEDSKNYDFSQYLDSTKLDNSTKLENLKNSEQIASKLIVATPKAAKKATPSKKASKKEISHRRRLFESEDCFNVEESLNQGDSSNSEDLLDYLLKDSSLLEDSEKLEKQRNPQNIENAMDRIDNESDRTYDDSLVGKKLRGHYETGWQIGTIDYFNIKLEEYSVSFVDGSYDYIKKCDIDGSEIILLEDYVPINDNKFLNRKDSLNLEDFLIQEESFIQVNCPNSEDSTSLEISAKLEKCTKRLDFSDPEDFSNLDNSSKLENQNNSQHIENPIDRIDEPSDQMYDDLLVGKKIRGHYETGWHIGKIEYFNINLEEYKVSFEDGSSDYIKKSDIDGTEIILLEDDDLDLNDLVPKQPKFPYKCKECPSRFRQLAEAKHHFFLKHEAKPVDSITEDIGNININNSRSNGF